MNYLAHLYLAEDTPESLLGNLMGDFVKGSDLERFSPALRAGIVLHRKVDRYTDTHPFVQASKARVAPRYRRYAGILVDVFYDHFLAVRWTKYSPVPLRVFSTRVYGVLAEHRALMPERMQGMAERMVSGDWLNAYAEVSGIEAVLARVSSRLRPEHTLTGAVEELTTHQAALEADFRRFFPELAAFARSVHP